MVVNSNENSLIICVVDKDVHDLLPAQMLARFTICIKENFALSVIVLIDEDATDTDALFDSLGHRYVDDMLRRHFAEQIECWEELEGLTDAQIAEMISGAIVPERIKKQLNENGYLIESYWESVSEASFDLVKKYRVSQGLPAQPND